MVNERGVYCIPASWSMNHLLGGDRVHGIFTEVEAISSTMQGLLLNNDVWCKLESIKTYTYIRIYTSLNMQS